MLRPGRASMVLLVACLAGAAACGGGQAAVRPPAEPLAGAPPASVPPPAAAGRVTEDEVRWALDLENKVKGGYAPTAEETARYEGIAKRLQAASGAHAIDTP